MPASHRWRPHFTPIMIVVAAFAVSISVINTCGHAFAATSGTVDLQVNKIVSLSKPPLCAGSSPTFRAFIRNRGTSQSAFFNIRWNADGQIFDGGHFSIPAGTVDTHDHIWQNLTVGPHTLTFIANFDHQITETNYNNNQLTISFSAADCASNQPQLQFPFNSVTPSHPETWAIIQGNNNGTHTGYNRFAFDLQRATCPAASGSTCVGSDADTANEPVLASTAGTIVFAEKGTGCVAIRHNSFTEGSVQRWYFTIYCHLRTPLTVSPGQAINGNDVIGQAWNTHTAASCSNPCPFHIHFSLFSATDTNANTGRRPEQPLALSGQVVRDSSGNGPFLKTSWPWDGTTTNQYLGWAVARP
jgi:peptidase M23-like protein/CARDB protein